MSNTKGSMLISNADAVGTELVNQLGGTGYKPTEWANAINLLGIKSADIPTALAGITPGSYSGSERGSIKYTTGNAVGAMLNKKYNTNRGFKPVEWEDAISKLTPLPENTVSGEICNIQDGADRVPIKSWEVEIAPTLTGKSAIECTQTGKNLFNVADYSQIYADRDGVDSYNYRYMIIQLKPNTTYTVSQNSGEYSGTPIILINNALPVGGANYLDLRKASDTKTYTTDSTGQLYIGSVNSYDDVAYSRLQECNVQIEVGSTATTYEPYQTPETDSVNLGRTIYGGTADVVKGDGSETYARVKISDLTWTKQTSGNVNYFISDVSGMDATNSKDLVCDVLTYCGAVSVALMPDKSIAQYSWSNRTTVRIRDEALSDATELINTYGNGYIAYPLATPETFTFTPITPTPETTLGTNNFWADEGDSEVTYHQDLDLIT